MTGKMTAGREDEGADHPAFAHGAGRPKAGKEKEERWWHVRR